MLGKGHHNERPKKQGKVIGGVKGHCPDERSAKVWYTYEGVSIQTDTRTGPVDKIY